MGTGASTRKNLRSKLGAITIFTNHRSVYVQADDIPLHRLSVGEKQVIQRHFHKTLLDSNPDIFLDAMVNSIQSSESFKNVVCYKKSPDGCDFHKWGHLIDICEKQLRFYDKIIFQQNLDPFAIGSAIFSLGAHHFGYHPHGFTAQFFEIWGNHMHNLASQTVFPTEDEKTHFLRAFHDLNEYVAMTMMIAYKRSQISKKYEQCLSRERANSTSRIPPTKPTNLLVMSNTLSVSTGAL